MDSNSVNINIDFDYQLDEFYLDLQQDGRRIELLEESEIRKKPFPGLRPFKTSEFQLFKGRGGQAEELIKRLKKNNLLAVIGSSGTGKSSIVRAGLIPQLFGGYLHEAGNKWNIAICRPGKNPIENLGIALSSVKSKSKERDKILESYKIIAPLLNNSIYGLLDVNEFINEGYQKEDQNNLLIIIDQFEELFRFDRKDLGIENIEAHFVNLLLKACINPGSSVYVIITMRSEFLGECVKFRGLPEAINEGQYLVPQLNRTQLKEVIESPIKLADRKIDPGLVELLINEIDENKLKENLDQLPILQHALMRSYNEATHEGPDTELSYKQYKEIGGMEMALANHAEAVYNGLGTGKANSEPTNKQKIAKIIFQTTTDISSDQKGGRRPVQLGNIYAIAASLNIGRDEINEVINQFRENETSFLMPPITTALYPKLMLDISHESLMRNWDRLNEWMNEEVHNGKLYKTLNERRLLNSQNKGNEDLLRGGLLMELLSWEEKYKHNAAWASRYHSKADLIKNDETNETAYFKNLDFLHFSHSEFINAREAEKTALEAKIKEAQKNKSRRLITGILIAAVAVSLIFSVLAAVAYTNAKKQERRAQNEKAKADSSRSEFQKERDAATESGKQALVERNKAESEAIKARYYLEADQRQIKIKEYQEKRANLEATRANNLATLLSTQLDTVETANRKFKTEVRKFEKSEFGSKLKDNAWWDDPYMSESFKGRITDTLFNLYYPLTKDNTSRDSSKAKKIEFSLMLMHEAESKKSDNYSDYLYLAKMADMYYPGNFIIKSVIDGLKDIVPYQKKFALANDNSYLNYSNKSLLVRFIPGSKDRGSFIVGNADGFTTFGKNDSLKRFPLPLGVTAVAISKDASRLLAYNTANGSLMVYDKRDTDYDLVKTVNPKKHNALIGGFAGSVNIAEFSPDKNTLATYNGIGYIICNLKSKTIPEIIPTGADFKNFSYSGDGRRLLMCYADSVMLVTMDGPENKRVSAKLKFSLNNNLNPRGLDSLKFTKAEFSDKDSIYVYSDSVIYKGNESGGFKQFKSFKKPFSNIYASANYKLFVTTQLESDSRNYFQIFNNSPQAKKVFPWHDKKVKDLDMTRTGEIVSADENNVYLWNGNDTTLKSNDFLNYADENVLKDAYTNIGKESFDNLDWVNMLTANKALAEIAPGYNIYNDIGIAAYGMGKYDSAVIAYKKSLRMDSTSNIVWNNLGETFSKLQNYSLAKNAFTRSYKMDSTYARNVNDLAANYDNEDKNDTAAIYYEKELLLKPGDSNTLRHLGDEYFNQNMFEAAIAEFKNAIQADTTNIIARANLMEAYGKVNQLDSAQLTFNVALKIDSNSEALWKEHGWFNLKIKRYDDAINDFKKALTLDPNFYDNYRSISEAYYQQGVHFDKVIEYMQKAINVSHGKQWKVWNDLAYYYNGMKKYNAAISAADSSIRLAPDVYNSYGHEGYAWLKSGHYDLAKEYLDEGLKISPNASRCLFDYACFYALKNNSEKAIEYLKKAINNGFDSLLQIEKEDAFVNLRNDQSFKDCIAKLKKQ